MIEHVDISTAWLAWPRINQAGLAMSRAPHLRDSPVTTRHLVEHDHGVNVSCPGGYTGQVKPDALAWLPDTQVYAFKCRLSCTCCGRSGADDEVEVRIYVEHAPFSRQVRARTRGPSLQSTAN